MSGHNIYPDYRDRPDSSRGPMQVVRIFDQKETAEDARKAYAREGYRTRIVPRSVRADRCEAFLFVLTVRAPLDPATALARRLAKKQDRHGRTWECGGCMNGDHCGACQCCPDDDAPFNEQRTADIEREQGATLYGDTDVDRKRVSEAEGSGYMLGPWATPVVREPTRVRGLTAFVIRFAVDGGEAKEWVRFARDRYDASDSAAEAIKREWPAATFFEIEAVYPTTVRGVSEPSRRYHVTIDLDNDAFDGPENAEAEVYSLLSGIAERIVCHGLDGHGLFDRNGNNCGCVRVTTGEQAEREDEAGALRNLAAILAQACRGYLSEAKCIEALDSHGPILERIARKIETDDWWEATADVTR